MSNVLSQRFRIIEVLRLHKNSAKTAKEIAHLLYSNYPDLYIEKANALAESGRTDIITQISAEIGSGKDTIKDKHPNFHWLDRPKQKRVYWYGEKSIPESLISSDIEPVNVTEDHVAEVKPNPTAKIPTLTVSEKDENGWDGSEEGLYPLFNKYLFDNHDIYPMRIDEKKSKNTRGAGGNSWLHPDIVALHPIAHKWTFAVKDCVNMSHGEIVNLWSFEVKKQLTAGNVRQYYFQAVSNSSWSNYGYLVATGIGSKEAMSELKMLHAIHGIGVIIFDVNDAVRTEIILPAKKRDQVDWESVNRLATENKDFAEFVNNISDYLKTKRLRKRDWHDLV